MEAVLQVDVGDDGAGTAHHAARRNGGDFVHLGERQHHAAGKRHGLAVIARAGAARRDRHAMRKAGGQHANDLRLVARRHHQIAGDAIELALQHRAVPVEIAALLLHDLFVIVDPEPVEIAFQRGDIHHSTISSSSSA